MDTNLDLFSDFLALLALEQATGTTLITPPKLTEQQKRDIYEDALNKVLEAILAPDDFLDDDEE